MSWERRSDADLVQLVAQGTGLVVADQVAKRFTELKHRTLLAAMLGVINGGSAVAVLLWL